jgi:reverse gyrase
MSLSAQAAAGVGNSRGKTLMVVESPTKAAKIQKFLGDDYKVMTAATLVAEGLAPHSTKLVTHT